MSSKTTNPRRSSQGYVLLVSSTWESVLKALGGSPTMIHFVTVNVSFFCFQPSTQSMPNIVSIVSIAIDQIAALCRFSLCIGFTHHCTVLSVRLSTDRMLMLATPPKARRTTAKARRTTRLLPPAHGLTPPPMPGLAHSKPDHPPDLPRLALASHRTELTAPRQSCANDSCTSLFRSLASALR